MLGEGALTDVTAKAALAAAVCLLAYGVHTQRHCQARQAYRCHTGVLTGGVNRAREQRLGMFLLGRNMEFSGSSDWLEDVAEV